MSMDGANFGLSSEYTGFTRKYEVKWPFWPLGTLHNKVNRKHNQSFGGQTTLSEDEERWLRSVLQTLSVWRCPVDMYELRVMVKDMLDKSGSVVSKFKQNLPIVGDIDTIFVLFIIDVVRLRVIPAV